MVFSKKILTGLNGPFRAQNGGSSQLWICCKDCFTILHNERKNHENHIDCFSEKILNESNLVILFQKWYVLITLDPLSVFL